MPKYEVTFTKRFTGVIEADDTEDLKRLITGDVYLEDLESDGFEDLEITKVLTTYRVSATIVVEEEIEAEGVEEAEGEMLEILNSKIDFTLEGIETDEL